jgi:hypothetical protein
MWLGDFRHPAASTKKAVKMAVGELDNWFQAGTDSSETE